MQKFDMTYFGNLTIGTLFKTSLKAESVYKKLNEHEARSIPNDRVLKWEAIDIVYVDPGTEHRGIVDHDTTLERGREAIVDYVRSQDRKGGAE